MVYSFDYDLNEEGRQYPDFPSYHPIWKIIDEYNGIEALKSKYFIECNEDEVKAFEQKIKKHFDENDCYVIQKFESGYLAKLPQDVTEWLRMRGVHGYYEFKVINTRNNVRNINNALQRLIKR